MRPLPPIAEDIDREVAAIVDKRGARTAIAAHGNLSPETVTRWLNPNDHAAPSPVASVTRLLYGAAQYDAAMESELWALLERERRNYLAGPMPDGGGLISELVAKTARNAETTTAIIQALADGHISARERASLTHCLLREAAEITRLQQLLADNQGETL